VNAKVDYTLLDRWRVGWQTPPARPRRAAAPADGLRSEGHSPQSAAEAAATGRDDADRRVVHLPLADD